MKWLSIILLVILCLLLISLFLNVKIIIDFRHYNADDRLNITMQTFFGLLKIKKEIPMIKVSEESPSIITKEKTEIGPAENKVDEGKKEYTVEELLKKLQDMQEFMNHVFGLTKIIKKFLKNVTIKHLTWTTTIGLENAAQTGVIVGAIWAIKGNIIGLISNFIRLAELPDLSVNPVFHQKKTETSLKCIFYFRIGHAMLAGMKIVKYWVGSKRKVRRHNLTNMTFNKTNSV